ncbi:YciI family protein [Mesorhizobium xinjiangense]|uniref:YciI family protein n=1 Tax=Mesorhizobium xinjiangense TaxID=2678685 RepID=UPI0012EDE648|nr:YciI family protein [Mesorhizobium xinjiangense]
MRYALLCYNSEAMVSHLPKADEEAMMARVRAAETKISERARIGPSLRLMPTTAATTVKAGDDPLVIDGPYAETKEQLLGFWIIECESHEDAIEAGRLLAREREVGGIEVRPLLAYNAGDETP